MDVVQAQHYQKILPYEAIQHLINALKVVIKEAISRVRREDIGKDLPINDCLQLAENNARRFACLSYAYIVGARLHSNFHPWRNFRHVLPFNRYGHPPSRDILRSSSLPLRIGRRNRLRILRCNLLLVSKDDWTNARREVRNPTLPNRIRHLQWHLLANAPTRCSWNASTNTHLLHHH